MSKQNPITRIQANWLDFVLRRRRS
jgi:hypothetical protein